MFSDDIAYTRVPKTCIRFHNIRKYTDKTISQCKTLCSMNEKCLSFEYGVAYGGGGGFRPKDCQLQDSADRDGCDGSYHNLDLYVRGNSNILCYS